MNPKPILSLASPYIWRGRDTVSPPQTLACGFEPLARFDAYLASDAPLACTPEQLFQGPVADSLTHIGQLTMLRRLAGERMKSENYFRADIVAGRVGAEQI